MEIVQPIRDKQTIYKIESILKQQNIRDYMMFRIGIYSGLRISDILKLKVSDLKNQEYFILREQKTSKPKRLKIQQSLLPEINQFLNNKSPDEYIFKSRQGGNKPISRIQAYNVLNKVSKQVGLNGEIGTHTLRKTFGYHMYHHSKKDITMIQKLLNHSSSSVTLRYIGILQDDMDSLIDTFEY